MSQVSKASNINSAVSVSSDMCPRVCKHEHCELRVLTFPNFLVFLQVALVLALDSPELCTSSWCRNGKLCTIKFVPNPSHYKGFIVTCNQLYLWQASHGQPIRNYFFLLTTETFLFLSFFLFFLLWVGINVNLISEFIKEHLSIWMLFS